MLVEPTEPIACELEKVPTTAMSAILKSTCSICDAMSGMLNRNIFFQREPVVMSMLSAIPFFFIASSITETS
ncbi:unknown [Ruminococcus sp. CAG:382]|nr:unknown [Ruminococcus sp. CAG:382]